MKKASPVFLYGASSSVGRVQDCDSCCRGFEPHLAPQQNNAPLDKSGKVAFPKRKSSLGSNQTRGTINFAVIAWS